MTTSSVIDFCARRVAQLPSLGATLWVRWPGALTGHHYGISTVRLGDRFWTRAERREDGEVWHCLGDLDTYTAARQAHLALPPVAELPLVSP